MIRVVVTGSECTGKTTLSAALALHYAVPLATEFVRDFVRETEAAPELSDVEDIARGQIAGEDLHTAAGAELVILDTDLLSTWVYSHHYYGECPAWIGQAVTARKADLYLLAGIDVPWSADDAQRDRGHMREEMHRLFRDELGLRGFAFIEISGSLDERLARATAAIDLLLAPGSL
jgi:nicotinamide riboside kinase